MIKEKAGIYAGKIGHLELVIRRLLEEGQEEAALRQARTSTYFDLCRAQHDRQNPDYFYRTAEDPRVLSFKLRYRVPEVRDGALVGSTHITLRGAFDHAYHQEERPAILVAELAEAYMAFSRDTGAVESRAVEALADICRQADVSLYLSFYESLRPPYDKIVPRLRNLRADCP